MKRKRGCEWVKTVMKNYVDFFFILKHKSVWMQTKIFSTALFEITIFVPFFKRKKKKILLFPCYLRIHCKKLTSFIDQMAITQQEHLIKFLFIRKFYFYLFFCWFNCNIFRKRERKKLFSTRKFLLNKNTHQLFINLFRV